MRTWEYKVVYPTYSDDLEAELNGLGAEGWEVVAGAGAGDVVGSGMDGEVDINTFLKIYLILKRPLQ